MFMISTIAWLGQRRPSVALAARCRPWVVAIVALSIFGVACGNSGSNSEQQPSPQEEVQASVKAKRLEIVDQSGTARIVLTTIEDGRPSMTFLDGQGKERAWLFLGQAGAPNLVLIDQPRVAQLDGNGEIRSAQYIDSQGNPVFSVMDTQGHVRVSIRLGPDGSPVVETLDAAGSPLWIAPPVP